MRCTLEQRRLSCGERGIRPASSFMLMMQPKQFCLPPSDMTDPIPLILALEWRSASGISLLSSPNLLAFKEELSGIRTSRMASHVAPSMSVEPKVFLASARVFHLNKGCGKPSIGTKRQAADDNGLH